VIDGANRNGCIMFDPTVTALAGRGLLADIETLHLDKGYDSNIVRNRCAELGIDDLVCGKRRKPGEPKPTKVKNGPHTLGLRWPVERTNSWFSNFGQLRRNTPGSTTNDSPRSTWPSPASSPSNSSSGQTAGARTHALSARVLSGSRARQLSAKARSTPVDDSPAFTPSAYPPRRSSRRRQRIGTTTA